MADAVNVHDTMPAGVETHFRVLAQQRPWRCKARQEAAAPGPSWRGGDADCAWRELLRKREWVGEADNVSTSCVSPQALGWAWARGNRPANGGQPLAWRASWSAGSVIDNDGQDKRIVIMHRMPEGRWRIGEWRWTPSARAATRRWQQERWNLLVARARQLQQSPQLGYGPGESTMLWKALESNIGARLGEVGPQHVRWLAEGLCLHVDAAAPGPQQLQLPYYADDSRLEQRAAMQLQLARRFAKATWLTPFSLVPAIPNVKSGAKFYAIWSEGGSVRGQLWIPTKGDGPLVRARVGTTIPAATASKNGTEQLAHARSVIERELLGVAARWTLLNE